MAFPSTSAVAVAPVLSNFSIAKKQEVGVVLMAEKVLPPVSSNGKQAVTVRKWDDQNFFGSKASGSARPPGLHLARNVNGGYNRLKTLSASSVTIICQEYGQEIPLDRTEAARADEVLNVQKNFNDICAREVLFAYEQRMVNLAYATANVTNNSTLSGGTQWSDYTNSTPVDDIQGAITTISGSSGLAPGGSYDVCVTLSDQVWNKLKFHPQMQTIMAYTRARYLQPGDMMDFFGFNEVNISYGLVNNAAEGQTFSGVRFLGKDVLIYFRHKNPGTEDTTFGITLQEWPLQALTYPEYQTNSDIIRNTHSVRESITTDKAGDLIKAAIA